MENNKALLPFGLVLAAGMLLSAIVAAGTFYKVRALDNTLQVTGSAKQKVVSDLVKWNASFSRTVLADDLKSGYSQISSDLAAVKGFMTSHGISEESLEVSQVYLMENYRYDSNLPREYTLRQTVRIQSPDVEKITEIAKNTGLLINQGLIFTTDNLEYYISNLPDLRVSLLGEAVKDASARADSIAQSGGKRAGALKSAAVGSVQVLQVNSTDVSDYGTYDTSTIEKEVMVTVRATFSIK